MSLINKQCTAGFSPDRPLGRERAVTHEDRAADKAAHTLGSPPIVSTRISQPASGMKIGAVPGANGTAEERRFSPTRPPPQNTPGGILGRGGLELRSAASGRQTHHSVLPIEREQRLGVQTHSPTRSKLSAPSSPNFVPLEATAASEQTADWRACSDATSNLIL